MRISLSDFKPDIFRLSLGLGGFSDLVAESLGFCAVPWLGFAQCGISESPLTYDFSASSIGQYGPGATEFRMIGLCSGSFIFLALLPALAQQPVTDSNIVIAGAVSGEDGSSVVGAYVTLHL